MDSNLTLAAKILEALLARKVRKFVICPGSFNSPFLCLLCNNPNLEIFYHFEERAAAFFALGLSKQSKEPVCVCVTSGTAVAECLPATIEAYYSQNAIVILSADREKALSASGYPQAINQFELLKSHTSDSLDIDSQSEFNLPPQITIPLHCNVRFCEPILNPDFETPQLEISKTLPNRSKNIKNKSDLISNFLNKHRKPLVIVEAIPEEQREEIKKFLLNLAAPIIAEARSGLRESLQLEKLLLKTDILKHAKPSFDCVLRIGEVPTTDLWRSLERDPEFKNIPVCSLTRGAKYSGLSRPSLCLDIEEELFNTNYSCNETAWRSSLLEKDQDNYIIIQELLAKYSRSEAALLKCFSHYITKQSFLYLGNSLAIREWNDFASRSEKNILVDANRGANGIDGQIASFFGAALAANRNTNFAVIGDLTFLYDCNSLTFAQSIPKLNFCLAVINNAGGKIFQNLPYFKTLAGKLDNVDNFLNAHKFNLAKIAESFEVESHKIFEASIPNNLAAQTLLEILPDIEETKAFINDYNKISSIS